MDDFVQTNERNYHAYCRVLAKVPGVNVLRYDEQQRNNFQYVVLEVDENESPLTRDQWLQVLHAENVLARRYFYPGVHRMEPYRTLDSAASSRLPVTERVLRRVLVLPTGTAVEPGDIELIGQVFSTALAGGASLKNQLSRTLPLPTLPLAPRKQEAA
jgi:dTDP-4-amino-4,6-dideoxygalactose transaminase